MKNLMTKKITLCAIFSAFTLIVFILESLFPPIIIPGAKMGLSNVFIILGIIILGPWYGFAILLVKILLGSVFAGNISAIIYSLPAGLITCFFEVFLIYFTSRISILAISALSAVINIIIQNLTFCIVTGTWSYIIYSPYLSIIGLISGIIVGFAVYLIIKKLPLEALK